MRWNIPIVTEQASVEYVAEVMRDENLGFLPIVEDEESRRVVGVVTDRDLVLEVVAENRLPRSLKAGDVMNRQVLTASPDDDLAEVEQKMKTAEIRRLPLVDAEGRLVGVISAHDIAQREDDERTGELFRAVSKHSAQIQ